MSTPVQALLVLEDGTVFRGKSIGANGVAVGEIVFNTAMTGYQEILTDPSYARQIVTLTYPHIGNTGANDEDYESSTAWAEALVVRDTPTTLSNRRSQYSLSEFLERENIVGISDIDTRALTRAIREQGALSACVMAGHNCDSDEALTRAKEFPGLVGMDLAKTVSCDTTHRWTLGGWDPEKGFSESNERTHRIVAYDFGVKRNILRLFVDRQCEVIVVPADTSAEQALAHRPDGIFLSNGPGDPEPCDYAIAAIRDFFKVGIPIFGICLGCQLLALAAGASTIKMKHGHHGANHPVKDLVSGQVIITSQNHGFCVDTETLPNDVDATHLSLFDGTLQGLSHRTYPAFGFQGHPEASPGPQDCRYLFDRFIDLIRSSKAQSISA